MADDSILFKQVSLVEDGLPFSFRLPAGESAACTGFAQQTGERVIRYCLGMSMPTAGVVRVFGVEPTALDGVELTLLRRRIGVVPQSGGLISNLNVWENLTLPLAYHSTLSAREINDQGAASLAAIAFQGDLTALPARLDPVSRRQIGIARAILTGADLLIGHAIFDGLNERESMLLAAGVTHFLEGKQGRSFLSLSAHAESLRHLQLSAIIQLQNGAGYEH